MDKKIVDHWPTAYAWGIIIGSFIGYFNPQGMNRWQSLLRGLWIGIVILIVPTFWLPSPKKKIINEEREDVVEKTKNGNES